MDAIRWERIQSLFHDALERPAAERLPFLQAAASTEPDLVRDVLALLEEDARGTSLLDRELPHVAHDVLDGSVPVVNRIGPYRIRSVLGQGGMGVVYLAGRDDLGSLAAIKILRDASLSPARRERFAVEQRTLARMNHPSIARLYDADVLADGTPYFVMEYVEGEPLTDYCTARALPLADRLRLFLTVCDAVQHAHRHAIVHRDLKPSNVLVTKDGSVKLLDFGIAKQLDDLDEAARQTRTGLRLMTPAYAAPEQVLGGTVGTYTDVYALGVMLYELLTGRLPFDLSRRTPGAAEAMIVEQEPERPSAAVRAAGTEGGTRHATSWAGGAGWADLDVLCLAALHKDPQRRYRTVEALARDVGHYLDGQPLDARPDSVTYRAGKFLRRNRRPVLAAAIAGALLIGLTLFYTARLAAARDAARAEAARTQRVQEFMLGLFTGGDDEVGPADTLRVITLLDRGLRQARLLADEPDIQAELYLTLGTIQQQLGNFAPADSLIRLALDQRRGLLEPGHVDIAEASLALGVLRLDEAAFDAAEPLVRDAFETTRSLPPEDPVRARAVLGLARLFGEREEHEAAMTLLRNEAAPLLERGVATIELSAMLNHLANAHYNAGEYAASDSLNRIVLAMDRHAYGDNHPDIASGLINLGVIQTRLGRYDEAERFLREALTIMRAYYGDDHQETASSMTMLAQTLSYLDRPHDALELLRPALAIRERVYGPDHPRVATTLNELGTTAKATGDLRAAEDYFLRAADIYRRAYGDDHAFVAIALSNYGGALFDGGDDARAEAVFRDVVARFARAVGPDHRDTGIARVKLGRVLIRQRRFAEAETHTRAGYDILTRDSAPAARFLQDARRDLVAIYEGLGRPDQVEHFRAEIARADAGS
jgi:eukaryotic-like serine/threonine-protein kinase